MKTKLFDSAMVGDPREAADPPAHLQALFDNSLDAILLVDDEKRFVDANPAACELLGYGGDELLTLRLQDVTPPASHQLMNELWREFISAGRLSGEYSFLCKDGTIIVVEFRAVARIMRGVHMGILHDITQRKRAEQTLRESEERLRLAIQNAPFPIQIHAEDGEVITVNRAWLRQSGYAQEDVSTIAAWTERAYGARKESIQADIDRLYHLDEVVDEGEEFIHTRNGETRIWHFHSSPLGQLPDGRRLVISMAADITERKQTEKALQQSSERLRELTNRLAEVEAMQRRNLALELHDRVGQTLTALNINLNILHDQISGDTAQRVGSRIDDSIHLVEETVMHVRDVMADLHPPVLEDFGLTAALVWYAEQFTRRTGIAVSVEDPRETETRLPLHLETILFRVAQEALTNVARHAHAQHVTISLEVAAKATRVQIEDDGCGFDPAGIVEPGKSSGWGLQIMRERIEAVGGRFRLETAPGQGAKISLEISPIGFEQGRR